MYQDVFAKDITKNKTVIDLFAYIDNFFYDPARKRSYRIAGIGKDCFICTRIELEYDEDDESPWGREVARYEEVAFQDTYYVYSLKPTQKQAAWLKKKYYNLSQISGVEAWHIIHNFVEQHQKSKQQVYIEQYDNYGDDYEYDDEDVGYCDIPNT